MRQRNHLAN